MLSDMNSYQTNHERTYLSRTVLLTIAVAVVITISGLLFVATGGTLRAQAGANCSSQYYIDRLLPTGARWQMCWESRQREGVVLYDIYYTPVGGSARKVLAQANLGQIHVPYDDNAARYHDSTDSGLGGSYLTDLVTNDCPGGTLLQHIGRNVVCTRVNDRGYAYKYTTVGIDKGLIGYELTLFSISHVGEYNYIVQWKFADDGAIIPSVGATGKLQRLGSYVLPQHGWPLRMEAGEVVRGASHTHNYYWRLDFDIDDKLNDLVEEFNYVPANLNQERLISVTQILTETARPRDAEMMRSWRIRDKLITNSDGHHISYHLEPGSGATRYIGPDYEAFTHNDFYVTAYNACEKFASHNPLPCGTNLADYVNGQSTDGTDLVLWYGVNFHHLVRDEDENYMPAHWDSFAIYPRDWTATNPLDNVGLVVPTNTPVVPPTNTPAATNTPVPNQGVCTVYTSTDVPKVMPNGSFNSTSTLVVPDAFTISDINANVVMSHTYVGDVTMILTQQSTNKSVKIIDRPLHPLQSFGCKYDDIVATLGDEAMMMVENQCVNGKPTVNGAFKPNELLSLFDGGQSNGTWLLKVIDNDPYSDAGSLNGWSLQICSGGEAPVNTPFADEGGPLMVNSSSDPEQPEKGDEPEKLQSVFLPLVTR